MSILPGIVGITGVAGSGKDTLANYLVRVAGYKRYALADPIKEELNRMFRWSPAQWEDRVWKETYLEAGRTPREWAQWLGARIRVVDPDWWIDELLERSYDDGNLNRTVISDVRYNNEAKIIGNLGGVVLQVTRHEAGPVTAHESENGVATNLIHEVLDNNGSPGSTGDTALRRLAAWGEAFRLLPNGP